MTETVQVVWFKRDLRIHDHAPLQAAASQGAVLPVYVVDPDQWQAPDSALRHWQFAAESVTELNQALAGIGLSLCCWHGSAIGLLEAIKAHYPALALHSHEETGNAWSYQRDQAVMQWCQAQGVTWHQARQHGVIRGLSQRKRWEHQWEALMTAPTVSAPVQPQMAWGARRFHHLDAERLIEQPLGHDQTPCPQRQRGGRRAGRDLWQSFIARRGVRYRGAISKPLLAWEFGSRLSPHLSHGTLSMREVVQSLRRQRRRHPADSRWNASLSGFSSRLYWHCHFIQKLESQPDMETTTLHPALRGLRERDPEHPRLVAWKTGQTGVPLVDACMRSLIDTGWLNFRMRAMLVSFATFGLGLHWREPALHLARLFTDYEPGIHYPQIQMQSGATGTNALRVYNPLKQADDHDSSGQFVSRWVPELADLPLEWKRTPWALPNVLRQRFAFEPGRDYPLPHDFETEARHWKDQLYQLRRTPQARASSRELLDRLASKRHPVTTRRHHSDSGQLSLFESALPPLASTE